jgi:GNAT superfamily N-acetyltransferase
LSSAGRAQRRAGLNVSNADDFSFRLARGDEPDRAFLFALFAATRAREMAAMPIDAASKDFLLRVQHRSMTDTYRREYPDARWEIVELGGEPVGLLVTHVGESFVTYVDIAILPDAQGQGLATRLMLRALEEPRRLGLPARVTVLAHNVASLRLCERLGFRRRNESSAFVELEWNAKLARDPEP